MCFFIIGSCIIGFTYQLMMEKVVTRETGPNDVSDTSFGPYVCVFLNICVCFLLLITVLWVLLID